MSEKLVCPICGEPTRVYMGNARKDRLCAKHADELKAGRIEKCEDCGRYHNVDQTCSCKAQPKYTELPRTGFDACVKCGTTTKGYAFCKTCWGDYDDEELLKILNKRIKTSNNTHSTPLEPTNHYDDTAIEQARQNDGKCIVCGEDAPNGSLCYDCWYEMLDFRDSFNKNAAYDELSEYYYNLKSSIYRMQNIQIIQTNCNKLMALAVLVKDIFGYTSLTNRVVNDIKDIIEKKTHSNNKEQSAKTQEKDSQKEELIRTLDGHRVKSHPESEIDNLLYEARIVHCYEKQVTLNADDQTLKADWFIPVDNIREGIYIEYWGMSTKEYLENKERKKKKYKEYNIPLIEIEKDDLHDKMGLMDRIIKEINALAKSHFKRDKLY